MKAIKNLVNSIKSNNNNNRTKRVNNKKQRKININIINRKPLRKGNGKPKNRKIAAANVRNMNRDFKILYQDGTTVKVTGRDLVYQIPSTLAGNYGSEVITIIPANPCYWLGTRIAALAQGYQNFRPLNMKFTYIPQVAVTQQGNVICGTLWNQAPSNENIQQSLRTSNGGMLSQCYKSFTSVVRMKSNLQFNLYKTAGTFDQESNPFNFMALAIGTTNSQGDQLIPGYFYVTWSFLLKNPIGNTNVYSNSGLKRWVDVKDNDNENQTIVFLNNDDGEIPMGAILQVDYDEEENIYVTYNGSHYQMDDNDKIWYFANSSIQQVNAMRTFEQSKLYYSVVHEQGQPSERIPTQCYFRTSEDNPDYYYVYLCPHEVDLETTPNRKFYILTGPLAAYSQQIYGMTIGTFVGFQEIGSETVWKFKILKTIPELIQLQPYMKQEKQAVKLRNLKYLTRSQSDKQLDKLITKEKLPKQAKVTIKQSKSDKYYTNIAPIFED